MWLKAHALGMKDELINLNNVAHVEKGREGKAVIHFNAPSPATTGTGAPFLMHMTLEESFDDVCKRLTAHHPAV